MSDIRRERSSFISSTRQRRSLNQFFGSVLRNRRSMVDPYMGWDPKGRSNGQPAVSREPPTWVNIHERGASCELSSTHFPEGWTAPRPESCKFSNPDKKLVYSSCPLAMASTSVNGLTPGHSRPRAQSRNCCRNDGPFAIWRFLTCGVRLVLVSLESQVCASGSGPTLLLE